MLIYITQLKQDSTKFSMYTASDVHKASLQDREGRNSVVVDEKRKQA